ncbi:hypothetical protein [Leptolyngbya sp. KIOST-1]|uniref:hypothetical protein n=1 Tax=Leptolyngbya sp. KIOST-1 TaxID=1229172 RepID=UPI0012E00854|nr:hypothetical protein [Leptolyngbya sp. KIOST-1]
MANKRHWVRLGGAVGDIGELKFGFQAPDYAYDGIKDELGVREISDNNSAKGVGFGINYPKPPRVRLSGIRNKRQVSAVRYCDPDKIGRVLGGSMADQEVKTRGGKIKINTANMAS